MLINNISDDAKEKIKPYHKMTKNNTTNNVWVWFVRKLARASQRYKLMFWCLSSKEKCGCIMVSKGWLCLLQTCLPIKSDLSLFTAGFKFSMIQLLVGADKAANLLRAGRLVREAASKGAQVVACSTSKLVT